MCVACFFVLVRSRRHIFVELIALYHFSAVSFYFSLCAPAPCHVRRDNVYEKIMNIIASLSRAHADLYTRMWWFNSMVCIYRHTDVQVFAHLWRWWWFYRCSVRTSYSYFDYQMKNVFPWLRMTACNVNTNFFIAYIILNWIILHSTSTRLKFTCQWNYFYDNEFEMLLSVLLFLMLKHFQPNCMLLLLPIQL